MKLGSENKRKSKKSTLIIYIFSLIGVFLFGNFLGNKIVNISEVNNKVYSSVIQKNKKNLNSEYSKKTNNDVNKKNISIKEENLKNNEKRSLDSKGEKTKSSQYKDKLKEEKICYLTFDDGPTKNITPKILEVLEEKNVRATFFVLGKMAEINPELILKEKDKGHLIANHTYCHDYKYLYSNPNNLIDDFKKCNNVISNITKEKPCNIVRFPGGSFNKKKFQERVNKEGFIFVDWNCLNGDAEALNVPEEKLIQNVKKTMRQQKHIVVLMHDSSTKQTTVRALGRIIDYIKSNGYTFKTLNEAF